jgi:hypothetical protein
MDLSAARGGPRFRTAAKTGTCDCDRKHPGVRGQQSGVMIRTERTDLFGVPAPCTPTSAPEPRRMTIILKCKRYGPLVNQIEWGRSGCSALPNKGERGVRVGREEWGESKARGSAAWLVFLTPNRGPPWLEVVLRRTASVTGLVGKHPLAAAPGSQPALTVGGKAQESLLTSGFDLDRFVRPS